MGYTRPVGHFCRRGASFILAITLGGLPVTAGVCASLCTGAESAVPAGDEHRGSAGSCHEPDADGLQLSGAASHHCNTHAGHKRESTLVVRTARADGVVVSPVAALPETFNAVAAVSDRLPIVPGAPPGPPAPARAPLVLRI